MVKIPGAALMTTIRSIGLTPNSASSTADHLLRRPTVRRGRQGASIEFDGQTLVNFGANDYLGLASDRRLTPPPRAGDRRSGLGQRGQPPDHGANGESGGAGSASWPRLNRPRPRWSSRPDLPRTSAR